jgi:flagellar protein FlaJ
VTIIIFLITIANIIAARIVYGGDRYVYYLFATVFFAISGILVILSPIIVGFFFTIPVPMGV